MSVLSDSIAGVQTEAVEEQVVEPELKTGSGGEPPTPPVSIWGESEKPLALISDIDHTIVFPSPDREFMDFSKSENDFPNPPVIRAIKEWYLSTESPTIYFVTNRAVGWHDVTIRWLVKYFSPAQYRWVLRMRPPNDFFSTPAMIKEQHLINEIGKKCTVQQVWEDDDECIAMYQKYGLDVHDAKETWPQ